MIVTGEYTSFSAISGEELFDPDSGKWSFTGHLAAARESHTATLLQNGQVLVAVGVDGFYEAPTFLNASELYNPATGSSLIPIPKIISALVEGKRLLVGCENVDPGAVILLNGEQQKTINDDQNPSTALIGKKAGRKIRPGDTVQVRNPDGTVSQEFTFTGS